MTKLDNCEASELEDYKDEFVKNMGAACTAFPEFAASVTPTTRHKSHKRVQMIVGESKANSYNVALRGLNGNFFATQ
jgi:hypothetical protein